MKKEIEILEDYIRQKGLRHTSQREEILRIFLSIEKHISLDELYRAIKKKNPGIGFTTVYRTMVILAEAGLCNKIDFGEGKARFEHKYRHPHHDHLLCIKCGSCQEVFDPRLEELQELLARKKHFKTLDHRLELFGLCSKCSK